MQGSFINGIHPKNVILQKINREKTKVPNSWPEIASPTTATVFMDFSRAIQSNAQWE